MLGECVVFFCFFLFLPPVSEIVLVFCRLYMVIVAINKMAAFSKANHSREFFSIQCNAMQCNNK